MYDRELLDDVYENGIEAGKKEGAKKELERYIDLLKKWDINQFNILGSASGGMVYECVLHDLEKRLAELIEEDVKQ